MVHTQGFVITMVKYNGWGLKGLNTCWVYFKGPLLALIGAVLSHTTLGLDRLWRVLWNKVVT